ncbi:MAG: hypothetical protein A2359_03390 [Candidatus Moranbacteria bacterium RIFOXYB1_FULL_43_19]|nr:MAG: hypothetical protein A2359_03390 [Candidatus Moranbacteria bacterium RIFOXYB1_FULL_43_19]OGI32545.1 MAG: hypothetical protein A2420_03145 [Candidatus Moranbacteria bacterium RIFOXYC1_FULL_44_13]
MADSTANLAIATGERASEAEARDSAEAVEETDTKSNFTPPPLRGGVFVCTNCEERLTIKFG